MSFALRSPFMVLAETFVSNETELLRERESAEDITIAVVDLRFIHILIIVSYMFIIVYAVANGMREHWWNEEVLSKPFA